MQVDDVNSLPSPAPSAVTLSGNYVRLVPLSFDHEWGLALAAQDGELWKLWYTSVPRPDGMHREIERRLMLQQGGSMLPFTVLHAGNGEILGMTTFMNIDRLNRRVEIGSTWYARRAQRSGVNTEAKLLLLRYAFEDLGCIAVEFRTHFINQQSRRSIERLGAKLDGILRNHMLLPNGTRRDTCVYSITDTEWPMVREHLQYHLKRWED
jgi:RimJ/RimL family protein N-acetyltransferase